MVDRPADYFIDYQDSAAWARLEAEGREDIHDPAETTRTLDCATLRQARREARILLKRDQLTCPHIYRRTGITPNRDPDFGSIVISWDYEVELVAGSRGER